MPSSVSPTGVIWITSESGQFPYELQGNDTVIIDGETYQYSPRYFDIIRDNQYRAVWETLDIGAGTTEIEMLNKIAESKETIIRFQGDSRVYDLTVSASDKTAIKQVLDAYEALKNK